MCSSEFIEWGNYVMIELIQTPPAYYDYRPNMVVEYRYIGFNDMRGTCPRPEQGRYVMACSMSNGVVCHIYLPDDTWAPPKHDYDRLVRHERGHCNGWPGNHPE